MSLKNTGLAHVPKLQHQRQGPTRPVIKTTPREFTGKLTLGGDAEVHLSEPSSPATPGGGGNSLHSIPSFSTHRTSTPPNMCYVATIQDRDRWGPDTTSRGTYTSVDLSALVGIHATKLAFLPNFSHLRHIDLGPLSSVVTIGDNFLVDCSCLNELDVSPLKGAKSIGNAFLSGCTSLARLDLSSLAACQSIGSDFLNRCMSLGSVDVSAMSALASVGDGFLRGCTSVSAVVFFAPKQAGGPPRLRSIGSSFLSGCSRLVALDLSTFSRLTVIPSYFLAGCSALRQVDLRSLKDVAVVESYCMWGCSSLLSVDCSAWKNVEAIGAYFLSGCTSLGSLDFSAMTKLSRIGCGFLSGCSYLRTLNLNGLPPASEVGSHFLYGCSGLPTVDLRLLSFLEHIDDCFLAGCRALVRLDLQPLSRVRSVGQYFLSGCSSLYQVDLQPMRGLRSALSYFLSDCTSLVAVDLVQLPHLRVRGGGMFDGCERLVVVQVASLQQLSGVDAKFLNRMQVQVVSLSSAEAAIAINSVSNNSATLKTCFICVEHVGSQSAGVGPTRHEDDAAPQSDTARGSSRTSKSTNSGASQGGAIPNSGTPVVDDFAKLLCFHQQKRITALEKNTDELRVELETVSRRLGAFTATAQKDMVEANQLIVQQKQRIEDLERENAALRQSAAVASSSPTAGPARGRPPNLEIRTPKSAGHEAPEALREAAVQCTPTINAAAPKKKEEAGRPEEPKLRQAARPRSASAGWFSWWGRQTKPDEKPSRAVGPLQVAKLQEEDSDDGYGDV